MTVLLTVALLVGAAMIATGAWMVYPPAGLIVGGLWLVGIPLMHERGDRR